MVKLLVTLGVLLWGLPAVSAPNMLLNGNFERDRLGWSLPGEAQVVRENVKEGRACLRITTNSPGWVVAGQDAILPQGAVRVRLSGWMRTWNVKMGANPWEKARLQVTFYNANGELVGGYPPGFDIDGTTDWTFYTRDYEVPQGAVRVSLIAGLHNATGTAWYDDLRLEAFNMQGNALEPITQSQTDTHDWYPLDSSPDDYTKPAVVDLSRYLHRPAGKHGFVTVKDGKFVFRDGTPVRFWGVNIVASNVFMDKTTAERTAARLAKFGCNMVRLHHMDASWAQPNIFGNHPTSTLNLSPEMLDRLDYFIYQCKKHGIYIYMDLLVHRKFQRDDGVRDWETLENGAKIAAHYNRRLIELQKKYAHDLLTHYNPYTKTRYVDEPTIAMMEIINESTLFWVGGYNALPKSYIQEIDDLFTEWCSKHSISRPTGSVPELLRARNTTVGRFLYELQTSTYKEIYDYLRSIGVKVPIAGSNHWENWLGDVLSNAQLDYIDRHAYWDHPQGGYSPTNRFNNNPMVKQPAGSTITWMGRQQMEGMPFIVTEWNNCWMNEWIAEAPVLMAAYGSMQDWDGLLQFDYSGGDWAPRMEGSFNVGNKPHVMAARVPAALVFLRNDVPPTASTYIYSFKDADDWLLRPMGNTLPGGLMLIQRVACRKDAPQSPTPDVPSDKFTSQHKMLQWARDGMFTINAPRTQGAVGFIGDRPVECQNVRIEAQTPFCQVVLTSLDDKPLSQSMRVLLTAVARAENSGQVYNPSRTSLLDEGKPPILMEPVKATITLKGIRATRVHILDHHGRRTGGTLPVTNGRFAIGNEKTFWYEIELTPSGGR